MSPSPTPSRARLVGAAILLAVFAAGGLAGAATGRALAPAAAAADTTARADCRDAHHKQRILDQLSLTPEQRERVDAIMERRRAETEAFWKGDGARMRAIVDSARAEVRAILTPAQRARYDRLREERRREREADSARAAAAR